MPALRRRVLGSSPSKVHNTDVAQRQRRLIQDQEVVSSTLTIGTIARRSKRDRLTPVCDRLCP